MRLSNPPEGALYDAVHAVSLTGTRRGLQPEQKRALKWLLKKMNAFSFHHGDCVGADVEAAALAHALGMKIYRYPSDLNISGDSPYGLLAQGPKSPLTRNMDIVNKGDCLVACPRTMSEELRSGTWTTVRYARKQGRLVWIVWPDGSLTSPDGA